MSIEELLQKLDSVITRLDYLEERVKWEFGIDSIPVTAEERAEEEKEIEIEKEKEKTRNAEKSSMPYIGSMDPFLNSQRRKNKMIEEAASRGEASRGEASRGEASREERIQRRMKANNPG